VKTTNLTVDKNERKEASNRRSQEFADVSGYKSVRLREYVVETNLHQSINQSINQSVNHPIAVSHHAPLTNSLDRSAVQ